MPDRLRKGWIAVSVGLGLALSACPNGSDADNDNSVEDLTIVVEADKSRILEEEQRLQDKRKTVQAEAATLEGQREALKKQLASLSKKDKKSRAKLEAEEKRLAGEERRMRQRLKSFEDERSKLEEEKTRLLERISALAGTKGGLSGGGVGRADMQRLTRNVSLLQKDVDKLNTDSAKRHDEMMSMLRDIAKSGGTRTVVISAPAAPSGGTISKRQVEKVRSQSKSKMRAKGILVADLPPAARDHEKSGISAMSSKDYSAAHDSFRRFASIIEGIRIDQAFVQAKMTRINRSYNEKVNKLDSNKHARLQKLLDAVSDSFSDGRYDRANKKINQIYALLSGK